MRLKNKVAIITGSASGFGKGIAKKFSEEGAKLILVDINSSLLKKVSKSLSQEHGIVKLEKKLSLKIGDKLNVIPVHSCLAVDKMGKFYTQDEKVEIMDDYIKKYSSKFNSENLKFSSKLKK